ncbi:MAG TPA: hypothetical protein VFH39_01785 [Candidatus Saccharimonadales bacterium]|nr:hypothetical protein [Candidatus Saccharimonadales bacterium]
MSTELSLQPPVYLELVDYAVPQESRAEVVLDAFKEVSQQPDATPQTQEAAGFLLGLYAVERGGQLRAGEPVRPEDLRHFGVELSAPELHRFIGVLNSVVERTILASPHSFLGQAALRKYKNQLRSEMLAARTAAEPTEPEMPTATAIDHQRANAIQRGLLSQRCLDEGIEDSQGHMVRQIREGQEAERTLFAVKKKLLDPMLEQYEDDTVPQDVLRKVAEASLQEAVRAWRPVEGSKDTFETFAKLRIGPVLHRYYNEQALLG